MKLLRTTLIALSVLACASPALAHRLKLFATLENGTISGYAFFVGSGRAQQADIAIADQAGREIARLKADDAGAFSWKAPAAQGYRLTANTGDGHVADAQIAADRFGNAADVPDPAHEDAPASTGVTQAQLERAVDAAVARQIRPLLEAYEAAEGRTRFNDIMGGIGMIIGLAGLSLWASARRKVKS